MTEIWQQIIDELDGRRRQFLHEIVHYPPPIPRCDAQYNGLLEERAAVAQEFYLAEQLSREPAEGDDCERIEQFVGSSKYLSAETKRAILAVIHLS